ncbi:MAG: hypothetical protein Q9224_005037 [Gallowayella concinna]
MGNSSSKHKYDAFDDIQPGSSYPLNLPVNRGPRAIHCGVPYHELHTLPHGMVGMTIWDAQDRFTNPETEAVLQQRIRHRSMQGPQSSIQWQLFEPMGPEKSGLASMGMIKGDDMGIAPGNRPGVGALKMHQPTLSSRERVSKRRRADAGQKPQAGSHDQSQGVKEKTLERSESECIEWDKTCEEVSKTAETTGQVERDIEKKKMLKKTGMCIMGFEWIRHKDGWRCWGGNHFVFHNQQLADKFVQWLQTLGYDDHSG